MDDDDRGRRRRRAAGLVGLAAAALVVAGATYALVVRDPVGDPMPTVDDEHVVVTLSLPGEAAAARCMVPNAEVLGRAEMAFEGEVVDAGPVVRLLPTRFYAGGPADQVEVGQASEEMQRLVLGVRFEEGRRYLVAANGGRVMVCGFSGEASVGLTRLYRQAFPE